MAPPPPPLPPPPLSPQPPVPLPPAPKHPNDGSSSSNAAANPASAAPAVAAVRARRAPSIGRAPPPPPPPTRRESHPPRAHNAPSRTTPHTHTASPFPPTHTTNHPLSPTPEYASFLRFAARCDSAFDPARPTPCPASLIPRSRPVRRVRAFDPAAAVALLTEGQGTPLIFSDGTRGWDLRPLRLDALARAHPSARVVANDRAPARRADAARDSRPQRTARLTLGAYLEYVASRPGWDELASSLASSPASSPASSMASGGPSIPQDPADTPFYLNGWRAFSDIPSLQGACPAPYFARHIDDNEQILAEVGRRVFGLDRLERARWARTTDRSLQKVFASPAGAITRLHYDCHDAHAWLAQVQGRKLFVCYAPSDTPRLGLIEGELETAQAAVDPLAPEADILRAVPQYTGATPRAFVLEEGEAVLVPRGWWHYAVALDRSVTVMKNFYHAGTNAHAMVRMLVPAAAPDA